MTLRIDRTVASALTVSAAIAWLAIAPAVGQAEAGRDPVSIIGGEPATRADASQQDAFRSIVSLVREGFSAPVNRHFCGATVIAPNWVLTAAHCLFNSRNVRLPASTLRIVAGIDNLRDERPDQEVLVVNVFVHPGYVHERENAYDDIALLELATSLEQPPVVLFSGRADGLPENSIATIAGWGALDYDFDARRGTFPDTLQFASVPLISHEICNEETSYDGYVSTGQLCAGFAGGGIDSCVGDSGGPLFFDTGAGRQEQIGVVSFGYKCGEPQFFGIYTQVAAYLDWIAQYVALPEGVMALPIEIDRPQENGPTIRSQPAQQPVMQSERLSLGRRKTFLGALDVELLGLFALVLVWRRYRNSDLI